jgi:hypothetical protein
MIGFFRRRGDVPIEYDEWRHLLQRIEAEVLKPLRLQGHQYDQSLSITQANMTSLGNLAEQLHQGKQSSEASRLFGQLLSLLTNIGQAIEQQQKPFSMVLLPTDEEVISFDSENNSESERGLLLG